MSVVSNIFKVLELFNVNYKESGNMITGVCPIHGDSDNPSALNLYHKNHRRIIGYWRCNTHHCEKIFKPSILGFIRGLLSHNKLGWRSSLDTKKIVPFQETLDFAQQFKIGQVSIERSDKTSFIDAVKVINGNNSQLTLKYPKSIVNQLVIPSKYYLDRGYNEEILVKYGVGDCTNRQRKMFNRAIVPIYDTNYEHILGCAGRSIFEKCLVCGFYHQLGSQCPTSNFVKYQKWLNTHGFKTNEYLYNLWFAKNSIEQTNNVILVEGPGDVWKLEEAGIHNSLAIFGSSLSNTQEYILDSLGITNVTIITDNDEAGLHAREQIEQRLKLKFKVKSIPISVNDVGDMKIEEIKNDYSFCGT